MLHPCYLDVQWMLLQQAFQHDLQVAADNNMLGSIDANRGDYQNGWDTDQFPVNIRMTVEAMLVIIDAGGLQGGSTNFDAKIRRNSTDLDDLFIAHVSGMDTFARALVVADKILTNSEYKKLRADRYASFGSDKGADFTAGRLTLEELSTIGAQGGEIAPISGKQELYESIINQYI